MRRTRIAVAGWVVGATVALAATTSAEAVRWSAPFPVTTGSVWSSSAQLIGGSAETKVLWSDSGTRAVWMRAIRRDGGLRPERRVTPESSGEAYGLLAAADGTGGAVVAWSGQDLMGSALYARRIDGRGRLGPVREIAPPGVSHMDFDVGTDARGNATIVWSDVVRESIEPKGSRVVSAKATVRRLGADGRVGRPVGIPAPSGELSRFPEVAVAPSGRTAISWWQGQEGPAGYALKTATIERDGGIGPTTEIAPQQQRWDDYGYPEEGGRRSIVDRDGNLTFVWRRSEGAATDLLSRRLTAGGRRGGVHRLGVAVSTFATPVVDRRGRVTVAWLSSPEPNSSTGRAAVRARRLEASGRPGRPWRLSAPGSASSDPALAVDRVDRVIAVWREAHGDPYPRAWSIRGRQIAAEGRPGILRRVSPARPRVHAPVAVAVDGRGTATAAWSRSWGVGATGRYAKVLVSRLVPAR